MIPSGVSVTRTLEVVETVGETGGVIVAVEGVPGEVGGAGVSLEDEAVEVDAENLL